MNIPNLTHLNGNLLCAIDCETTGLDPKLHDLVEIAIVPLDSYYRPLKFPGVAPFNLNIQPVRLQNIAPDAFKVNGKTLADLMAEGMEPIRAADRFDAWWQNLCDRLKIAPGKRISPLAHNWPFDREFVRNWLGDENFQSVIDGRYRDTQAVALFLNDLADLRGNGCPFAKISLVACCNRLGIELEHAHTAIDDAIATAEVWRKMLYTSDPILLPPVERIPEIQPPGGKYELQSPATPTSRLAAPS